MEHDARFGDARAHPLGDAEVQLRPRPFRRTGVIGPCQNIESIVFFQLVKPARNGIVSQELDEDENDDDEAGEGQKLKG